LSTKESYDDAASLLMLVPFVASGVYAIYLWTRTGLSALLPATVYLDVTRDPYVFLAGSLAVIGATLIGVAGTVPEGRPKKTAALSVSLQKLAVASLVLAILAAWYSNGFLDLSGTAVDFVYGKYTLVFPGLLVLLSYLMVIPLKFSAMKDNRAVGVISLLLVPAALYAVGKRIPELGIAAALLLILLGTYVIINPGKSAK
jgi:hypothetical protein